MVETIVRLLVVVLAVVEVATSKSAGRRAANSMWR